MRQLRSVLHHGLTKWDEETNWDAAHKSPFRPQRNRTVSRIVNVRFVCLCRVVGRDQLIIVVKQYVVT